MKTDSWQSVIIWLFSDLDVFEWDWCTLLSSRKGQSAHPAMSDQESTNRKKVSVTDLWSLHLYAVNPVSLCLFFSTLCPNKDKHTHLEYCLWHKVIQWITLLFIMCMVKKKKKKFWNCSGCFYTMLFFFYITRIKYIIILENVYISTVL